MLSPRLYKVLRKWDQENWGACEQRQKLAYVILVELLAYQFVSPVRWIETQDILFQHYKFERFIELGPSPTFTGMATRTFTAKYETQDDSAVPKRGVLCHTKNAKEVYHQFEGELEAPPEEESEAAPAATPSPAAAAAAPVFAAVVPPVGGNQNEILSDLQLEFSAAPKKGEELGLPLDLGYCGSLGKYTSGLISRLQA